MSSFSSFVRKPGKVAAPKKIPQRRVPKSATPASAQDTSASVTTNGDLGAESHSNGIAAIVRAIDEVENVVRSDSRQGSVPIVQESDTLNSERLSQEQQARSSIPQLVSHSNTPTSQTDLQHAPSPRTTSHTADDSPVTVLTADQESLNTTERQSATQPVARNDGEGQQDDINKDVNQPARRTRGRKAKETSRRNSTATIPDSVSTTLPTRVTDDDLTRSTPPPTQPVPSSPASSHADAFQQITSRLQSGIAQFRASQTPSRAGSVAPVQNNATAAREEDEDAASQSRPRKRRKRNDGQTQTIQEQVAEVVAHATGNEDLTPRVRRGTPEDAEEHEIEADTIKLAELCDDHKWGRKSNREKEMAANWPEILRRRKQENEERMQKAEERRSRKRKDQPLDGDTGLIIPEQAIVNGEIVAAGRVVDNRAHIVLEANDESRPVLEARDIFNRVTQDTIAPRRKLPSGQFWDEANTDLFYQGLSMFGTDFNMIANMIPSKNRRQVKLKYNMEERNNWSKVKAALNKTETVSLDQYADMTGLTFGSVEDLYKELEEDEKRIRAEDEARRKEEGIISQPANGETGDATVEADIAVPSIEDQEAEQAAPVEGSEAPSERARSTATTRVGSVTTGGRQTAQPPGATKKKPTRKTNPNTKRGRQAANKRNNLEGIEESLGPADQVRVPMT